MELVCSHPTLIVHLRRLYCLCWQQKQYQLTALCSRSVACLRVSMSARKVFFVYCALTMLSNLLMQHPVSSRQSHLRAEMSIAGQGGFPQGWPRHTLLEPDHAASGWGAAVGRKQTLDCLTEWAACAHCCSKGPWADIYGTREAADCHKLQYICTRKLSTTVSIGQCLCLTCFNFCSYMRASTLLSLEFRHKLFIVTKVHVC